MSDEDDLEQVFTLEHADDVLDVGVETYVPAEQMRALAQSGQGRGVDLMTRPPQMRRDPLPTPAAQPSAVDENEGGHCRTPLGFCSANGARCTQYPIASADASTDTESRHHVIAKNADRVPTCTSEYRVRISRSTASEFAGWMTCATPDDRHAAGGAGWVGG